MLKMHTDLPACQAPPCRHETRTDLPAYRSQFRNGSGLLSANQAPPCREMHTDENMLVQAYAGVEPGLQPGMPSPTLL